MFLKDLYSWKDQLEKREVGKSLQIQLEVPTAIGGFQLGFNFSIFQTSFSNYI